MKKVLEIKTLENYPTEIGMWLWAMEEARKTTKKVVSDISQEIIDWSGPAGNENSIATLLYHIAAVEMNWLYFDILEQTDLYPENLFPFKPFQNNRLAIVKGISLEEHLVRLDESRAIFLKHMESSTLKDWSRLRSPEDTDYSVSPAWAVFHLVEHEAGHAAQIAAMKKRASIALSSSS